MAPAFKQPKLLHINGTLFDYSSPCVMGIVNITPDSFYAPSRFGTEHDIVVRVQQILDEGAKIIDIGALSSRPGAALMNVDEEKKRLNMALPLIRKEFPHAILSVDTFRADIAQWVVGEFNANIINDISGGTFDNSMFKTIARLHVPYILMHLRGNLQTLHQPTNYTNITKDVMFELSVKVNALNQLGVTDVILDPGFGFSKTMDQNYALLHDMDMFKIFELPMLVGVSRKSMIYKALETDAEHALTGTIALHMLALERGASILRAHDVKQAVEVCTLYKKFKKQE